MHVMLGTIWTQDPSTHDAFAACPRPFTLPSTAFHCLPLPSTLPFTLPSAHGAFAVLRASFLLLPVPLELFKLLLPSLPSRTAGFLQALPQVEAGRLAAAIGIAGR